MVNVDRNFSKMTLKDHGAAYEQLVAIEESSELIKAITKLQRYPATEQYRDCIIEEMADCYICLKTLQVIYDVMDVDMQDAINKKIARYNSRRNAVCIDDFIEE